MHFHTPRGVRASVVTLVTVGFMASGLASAGPALASTAELIPDASIESSAPSSAPSSAAESAAGSLAAMPAPVAPPTRTALNRARLLSTQVPARATIAANRTSITAGTQVRLTGKVAVPAFLSAAGLRVSLQERRGGTWTTVATTKLSTSGVASFLKSPQQTVQYRMRHEGSLLIAATNSSGVTVTVRSNSVKSSAVKSSAVTSSTAKATTASVGGTTATKLAKVLATAKAQTGDPYVFGAAGPNSFDCSGLTQYAYKSVGITLPHKANSQKSYGRGITRTQASPGDLIIFLDGGYGYHAAIYAGGGYMYDAPRAGSSVGKHKIWSTNIIFRRLV